MTRGARTTCVDCGVELTIDNCHVRKTTGKFLSYCRSCANIRNKKSQAKDSIATWSSKSLARHRFDGYDVQMTTLELTEIARGVEFCPICGTKMTYAYQRLEGEDEVRDKATVPYSATLDRVDNGPLVSRDTIWIICHQCNATKQARTLEEFIAYCAMVVERAKGWKCKSI